jgi:DNA-binding NarL/FixJ family response regulator
VCRSTYNGTTSPERENEPLPSHAQSLPERVRVLVADSNLINGQLIAGALRRCRDMFEVLGSTTSYADTLHLLKKSSCDVAVISTELREGPLTGFKVLHQIRASGMKTATVMMMDENERDLVIDSFRGGARGVFCRGSSIKSLSKCIRTIHSGQLWVSNEQLECLLELITRLRPFACKSRHLKLLSRREAEVAELVSQGLKNAEIARELHVAEHTIRNYVFHIFEKLGLSSRVELVLSLAPQQQQIDDQAEGELDLRTQSGLTNSRSPI